ncbi:glycosyltransferase family 31 protein [Patellaria atrata CBS 101060]|uniref:N-acetylgalactosaminide beta-1,3-galactosyltransferase n=1 Tax=Patellaria atrata CBS 101060 TaxID=1346257 RepID=A0A9P4VT56_9PEZI|nr:glycosyltransferase family 31 protein [Patellaria atrata CBS 101060]
MPSRHRPSIWRRNYTGPRLLIFFTFSCLIWLVSRPPRQTAASFTRLGLHPLAEQVLLILKTGATELYTKLPIHFSTMLSCHPLASFLLFSDLAQQIGIHIVHDALANVTPETRTGVVDFELYNKVREIAVEGGDISVLSGQQSWDLDKWKFLPMMRDAWTYAQKQGGGYKWYIMLEADTYIHLPNLYAWLDHMDASEPRYLGSAVVIADGPHFAHGGSGVVLSAPAVAALVAATENRASEWEQKTRETCCGDEILAKALVEGGVTCKMAHPHIQGETAWSLDWRAGGWCRAVVTWHHLRAGEVDALWRFERGWIEKYGVERPILFRDVYEHFVAPHLRPARDDWDSRAESQIFASSTYEAMRFDEQPTNPLQEVAWRSFEDCQRLCEAQESCLQFVYKPEFCGLGDVVKLGKRVEKKEGEAKVRSVWYLDRIERWMKGMPDCENESPWVLPA